MNKSSVLWGSVLILIGIILGAFGAHALKEVLRPEQLTSFETGVRYQMYHGLALLIIGLNAQKFSFNVRPIQLLILFGLLFFSGSIYALSMQDVVGVNLRFLGPVTPIGGLLLIFAWGFFILKIVTHKTHST